MGNSVLKQSVKHYYQWLRSFRGMGVIDISDQTPVSSSHPPKLKEVPTDFPQFSGVSVNLPTFQPSHGPTSLYNDRKGSEADGPHKRNQTSPVSVNWLIRVQSKEEAIANIQTLVDLIHTVLQVDNQSREVRTKTGSDVFVCGLQILPAFIPCKTHSREMAQTS